MNKSLVAWCRTSRKTCKQNPRKTCIHFRSRHKNCCNCNKCFTNGKAFNMRRKLIWRRKKQKTQHWRLKGPGQARKIDINQLLLMIETPFQGYLHQQSAEKISLQFSSNPHSIENDFKNGPHRVKVHNLNFLLFTPATSDQPGRCSNLP